ncbi:MAG: hypothetical protein SFX73_20215 [Kofleriaceae bacterium]|nr:hypothetical protein [Kofleriaceae bacterium]
MRHVSLFLAVAGCAAGSRPQSGEDASAQHDAAIIRPDGSQVDGPQPQIDAPMIDAPLVDAPVTSPDGCVPVVSELVQNGNFDGLPIGTPWTEVRYQNFPLVVVQNGFNAQSGTQYGLLGDYEADPFSTADDFLYQQFVVPANTTELVVSGFVAVGTAEPDPDPYDVAFLGFLFPNTPATQPIIVLALDNTDAATTSSWTPFTVTIPQNLSGQTLRFQMESSSDDSYPTAFAFDTLSVRATHGCP